MNSSTYSLGSWVHLLNLALAYISGFPGIVVIIELSLDCSVAAFLCICTLECGKNCVSLLTQYIKKVLASFWQLLYT